MKILFLVSLLSLVGCGSSHDVNVDEIRGGTTHTFGPDFKQWLDYCKGEAQYKFDVGNITENEIDLETRECYYNLDLSLPDLSQGEFYNEY